MVLMLELVGIGVFGACLSAMFCMITDCTPYEIPKIISFKNGLLRPQIIRPVNFSPWKSEVISEDGRKKRMCRQKREEPFKSSSQNLRSKVLKICKHSGTSTCNLEQYHPTMSTKAVGTIEKYYNEDYNLGALPCAERKNCKYCGKVEKSKLTQSIDSNANKMHLMKKNNISNIKTAFYSDENHKISCAAHKKSHKSNETIVRIKKKRFNLPKNLIIAKKVGNAEHSEKFIDREFPTDGDYCYLEALRIKTNKADKIA